MTGRRCRPGMRRPLRVPATESCSVLPGGQVGLITERVKAGVLPTCQQLIADAFFTLTPDPQTNGPNHNSRGCMYQ